MTWFNSFIDATRVKLRPGVVLRSAPQCCFIIPAAVAQTESRAYAGDDGKAHVIYVNGVANTVPPNSSRSAAKSLSVARDEPTVGWSCWLRIVVRRIQFPAGIVVYRNGKNTAIFPVQMIYPWRFIRRSDLISIRFGPVHGYSARVNFTMHAMGN